MAGQDLFLDIAMTKHPVNGQVEEVQPVSVERNVFPETNHPFPVQAEAWKGEKSLEERTCEFEAQLEQMRKQYLPFMADYSQKPEKTVKKQELKQFSFRYLKQGERLTERNSENWIWEEVTIPDYRGPADKDGRWTGCYRTWFRLEPHETNQRVCLQFQCVDYIAEIYVNGNFAGRHEGFFAPFSFDVTDLTDADRDNELVIVCKNDIPTLGIGDRLDGDKLYAATGPGWDDPETGWHHCPAGAGVFGRVTVEYRPELHICDLFVRSDIDADQAEIRVGIENYTGTPKEAYELELVFAPRNYHGEIMGSMTAHVYAIGNGGNEFRYRVPLIGYRLWEPETPWLGTVSARLLKDGQCVSTASRMFGMKKFVSDETTEPKGKFFLNNRPCVLRGANEMGHLQQCVMQENMDLLIDDILIAKMCHMNYYRVTQRPVQEEIYEYFDMLGIMHQCDLPLFGYLRRNQFCEAVKQAAEMEHLIRGHVSTVLVTFINEPMCVRMTEDPDSKYSRRYYYRGQRDLFRDELEAFFAAARKAIYVENPDRVIKNVEGDYDPPTSEGLPDFHCYTMWYSNHGEPIGRLRKGYLPPVKQGWMIGCGEYGAEGLDNADLMYARYPKEWMEPAPDGNWYPDRIVKAQTHSVQGDWYKEQTTVEDWVRESQRHQAIATKMMTDAYRRRADVISHTAIHLLIDAWPAGWMKTLVGCDRKPKAAYFAYQEALVPLRVNLYCDRQYVYGGETVETECWLLNDRPDAENVTVRAALCRDGKAIVVWEMQVEAKAATSVCAGQIPVRFPECAGEETMTLQACMLDSEGNVINEEQLTFFVYPKTEAAAETAGSGAAGYAETIGIRESRDSGLLAAGTDPDTVSAIETALSDGKTVVWLANEAGKSVSVLGTEISWQNCPPVFFAAADGEAEKYHMNMLYNEACGYMDFIGERSIVCEEGETLVYTYKKQGFQGSSGPKPRLPFVKKLRKGNGILWLVSLSVDGRLGGNANLDAMIKAMLQGNL